MSHRLPLTLTTELIDQFSWKLKSGTVTITDRQRLIDALSSTQAIISITGQIAGTQFRHEKHIQSIQALLKALLSHFGKGDPASGLINELLSERQTDDFLLSPHCLERTRLLITLFV